MKVFAVGTGCTWFERNNTSFILDDEILFDTPNGSYKTIIKLIDLFKLKGIFISHFHSDHFVDLHIIATRFMRENHGRTEKLKVFGPKGTLDKLVEFNKAVISAPDECDKDSLQKQIDFIDVSNGDEFEFDGYKVKVYALDHGLAYSQGYTFEKDGKVVAFTADTRDCENLRNMLQKSDVAFVDVAAMEEAKSHIDVKTYEKLIKTFPNCKMYAVHTSDKTLEYAKKNNLNALDDGDTIII